MNKKEIISEINRVKEIMGLTLITEGNILTETTNFWKTLLTKNVDELLPEEKEIIEGMIKRSSELSTKNIKNLDELLSPSGKNTLRTLLKSNGDDLSKALKGSIDYHYQTKIAALNQKLSSIPNFKNQLEVTSAGPSGSALDVLQNIGRNGVSRLDTDTLYEIVDSLRKLKLNVNVKSNVDVQEYIDNVINDIEDNLNTRNIDFKKQISEIPDDVNTGASTKSGMGSNLDELKNEKIETFIGKIQTQPEFKLLDKGVTRLLGDNKDKFLEWVKLTLKGKTIGELSDDGSIDRLLNSELEKRISKLTSSSNKVDREAGQKLKTIAERIKGVKGVVLELPGGKYIWAVSSLAFAFWVIGSTTVSIYEKDLQSYGPIALFDTIMGKLGLSGGKEFTVKDCQKYFDDNNYDAIATSVDVIDDNNCKCNWKNSSTTDTVEFTLNDNTWVPK